MHVFSLQTIPWLCIQLSLTVSVRVRVGIMQKQIKIHTCICIAMHIHTLHATEMCSSSSVHVNVVDDLMH